MRDFLQYLKESNTKEYTWAQVVSIAKSNGWVLAENPGVYPGQREPNRRGYRFEDPFRNSYIQVVEKPVGLKRPLGSVEQLKPHEISYNNTMKKKNVRARTESLSYNLEDGKGPQAKDFDDPKELVDFVADLLFKYGKVSKT